MSTLLQEILLQMLYYFIAMCLPVVAIAFLMRGFLWKYLKVRSSFNRKLLIKMRTLTRDYYLVGEIKDGFLCYQHKKEGDKYEPKIAISQDDYRAIYRTLGISMIDMDEEKQAICRADYSTVSGYDAKKISDLTIRCLQKPAIGSQFEKIVIGVLIAVVLLGLAGAYVSYHNTQLITQLQASLPELCKGTITGVVGKV